MNCPNCGLEQWCGLDCCKANNQTKGRIVEIWVTDELIACGRCGLTMSVNQWEDLEYSQILEQTGAKSLTEAMEILRQRKNSYEPANES